MIERHFFLSPKKTQSEEGLSCYAKDYPTEQEWPMSLHKRAPMGERRFFLGGPEGGGAGLFQNLLIHFDLKG